MLTTPSLSATEQAVARNVESSVCRFFPILDILAEPVEIWLAIDNTPGHLMSYCAVQKCISFSVTEILQSWFTEQEIDFIVAHELSHMVLNHWVKRLRMYIRYAPIFAKIDGIPSGQSELRRKLLTRCWASFSEKYTKQEVVADQLALLFLIAIGRDPGVGLAALDKFKDWWIKSGGWEWFDMTSLVSAEGFSILTHPLPKVRREVLQGSITVFQQNAQSPQELLELMSYLTKKR